MRVLRVLREISPTSDRRRIVEPMPSARACPDTPIDAAHERAILARLWPAALRDVLLVAARVDRFNRRAGAAGVAPISDRAVAAVGAMWAGLLDAE